MMVEQLIKEGRVSFPALGESVVELCGDGLFEKT